MEKTKGKFITVGLTCLLLLSSITVPVIACLPDPPPGPPLGLPLNNIVNGGDPVYLKNGEYYLSARDLLIWGRVMPVQIVRSYGSREGAKPGLGHAWDMNYNLKVVEGDDYTVMLHDGEHRELEYTRLPSESKYTAPPGLYDYIEKVQPGIDETYMLYKKHGTRFHFDSVGRLDQIIDRHGNTVEFSYTDGLLTTITDDLERDIDLTYNSNDLLETITDSKGRTWTYGYDPNRDLLSITGPVTAEYPSGLTTTYTYDGYHNLLTATDPAYQTYLTNSYTDDWLTSQTYGGGTFTVSYNPGANRATVTDRKGYDTEFVYNSTGNPVSNTTYTNNLRPDDPSSYTTLYAYNSDMEITRKTFPKGNCIDYTYDATGNVSGIYRKTNPGEPNDPLDPDVIGVTYTYEENFNFVKEVTSPRGHETTCTYDTEVGNLMKITFPAVPVHGQGQINPEVSFTYNSFGQLVIVTAPDGIVTKFEYYVDTELGRLWKVIRDFGTAEECLNMTTQFAYDDPLGIVWVEDPGGNITEFTHNNLDQLKQIKAPSPFYYLTKFSYNENKKLSKVQAQLGQTFNSDTAQTTEFTYEILDHLTKIINPLGKDTEFGYDNSENPYWLIDAEDHYIIYEHDERNLLWKTRDVRNGAYAYTEYSYDDNGNLRKIEDAKDQITAYDYDDFDRLETITYHDDTTEVFSYDKSSNVHSWKNRKDETIIYQYDALNRLTSKTWPNSERVITYAYDRVGRLVEVSDSQGGGTKYEYDRLGRVIKVDQRYGTSSEKAVKYQYDGMGRRQRLTYPDDSYITYHYDELSRLTDIKDQSDNVLAHYTYDELSRRKKVEYYNETTADYDYVDRVGGPSDVGNTLENLTNNFTAQATKTFDYTYDDVGNRLTMTVDSTEHSYSYNEVYQLKTVNYPVGDDATYNYDKLGNRTSVVQGGTTSYTLNSKGLNQYGTVGGISYSYDDNGNLVNINNGQYEYVYDYENRLTEAKNNSETVGTYSYDFAGRRITKIANSTTTKYYYDGDQVIAEYEGDTLVRKFIYGPGIDEPICMIDVEDENAKYYYHYDALGSVVALSNSSGNIVETYSYDVFGEPSGTGSVGNPYFFTGRRFDTETALYYYRFRYYKPDIGRFLQTDPIGYYDSMNLYTYCGNNPIMFVDPYGLCDSKGTSWVMDSIIATGLAWLDALGLPVIDLPGVGIPSGGEFGLMDTYDMKYVDTIINPYPNAGRPGASVNERSWDPIHEGAGFALGLAGVDETRARTLMEIHEMTEPGIWSFWGSRVPYQGRNVFEEGQRGIDRDMERGMAGYEAGRAGRAVRAVWDYFRD